MPGEEEDGSPLDNLGYLRRKSDALVPRELIGHKTQSSPGLVWQGLSGQSDPYPVAWNSNMIPGGSEGHRGVMSPAKCGTGVRTLSRASSMPSSSPRGTMARGRRQCPDLY